MKKAPYSPPKGDVSNNKAWISKIIVLTISLLFGNGLLVAQSYDQMETRFVKKKLTKQDSAAFIESGIQKAQSLFGQTDLYWSNSGNASNQAYIATRIPDLFYVAKGDSLDLEPLMAAIKKIQSHKNYTQPKFKLTEAKGYLGKITTTNTDPKLEFFLVLLRAPKRFGSEEEKVWQVFLAEPVVR